MSVSGKRKYRQYLKDQDADVPGRSWRRYHKCDQDIERADKGVESELNRVKGDLSF